MASSPAADILEEFDKRLGRIHAGFRPVHAKGVMYSGNFTPATGAANLTRAPHATKASTPVTVRFSLSAGLPSAGDNDPTASSPQGIAVRFHLGEHVHTD